MAPQLNNIREKINKDLYQEDFYLWLGKTAQLLRESRFQEIDLEYLIEEIESMGRSEKRELENRIEVLIEHLLKLMYWEDEKAYNSRGWRITVIEQRRQIEKLLKQSPSLQGELEKNFDKIYQNSRQDTLKKYKLSGEIFPENPPFTCGEVLNSDYLPES